MRHEVEEIGGIGRVSDRELVVARVVERTEISNLASFNVRLAGECLIKVYLLMISLLQVEKNKMGMCMARRAVRKRWVHRLTVRREMVRAPLYSPLITF